MSKTNPGLEGGHILVDLDGTMAHKESGDWSNFGPSYIGAPVTLMVAIVKLWLHEGRDVRIFTARVYDGGSAKKLLEAQEARRAIDEWSLRWLGRELPVTNKKNASTDEIWDDIAVSVQRNTGLGARA